MSVQLNSIGAIFEMTILFVLGSRILSVAHRFLRDFIHQQILPHIS